MFQEHGIAVPLEAVRQRIDERFGSFSPQLRRVASFVRDHPQDVALNSLRTVAREAGVSPTSVTRLVQALGFEGYDAFQAAHRAWLTGGRPPAFSDRADRLISEVQAPEAEDAALDALAEAERGNVAASLAPERRGPLKQAAAIVLAAPGVTVAGIRSCFPAAYSFHYSLSLFMPGARLMTGTGASFLDDLHHLSPGDAMVAISVAPYSRETVEAARFAHGHGVQVIAITDGPRTPMARLADVTLVASNDCPAHIASPIGPIAVSHALAMLVLARAGSVALERLRRREATLEATAAYVGEGAAA